MKFNFFPLLKDNAITCFLSILIIALLAYFLVFKKDYLSNLAIANKQTVILSANSQDISFTSETKNPVIAIVIADLGLEGEEAIQKQDLSAEITLGFSVESYDKPFKHFSTLGHELMLNIPLEPTDYPTEPAGDLTLITELPEQENLKKLEQILDKASIYQGLYSIADEKFTLSQKEAEFLLAHLKQKNILFLSGNNKLSEIAKKMSFHILTKDVILDDVISPEAIEAKLAILEKIAHDKGYAIAFGNSYPLTLKLIQEWMTGLNQQGIKIVPITELYNIVKKEKK